MILMAIAVLPPTVQAQEQQQLFANALENQLEDQTVTTVTQTAYQLTLADAVYLTIENNQDLKIAYLNRILQRQMLAESESTFQPTFTPEITASNRLSRIGSESTQNQQLGIGATLNWSLPTGGNISVAWQGNTQSTSDDLVDNRNQDQNFRVGFQQPLLRGFGSELNQIPIERARLTETENQLTYRNTIATTITSTIVAYRNLILAQETLKIEQLSLKNAQRDLERLNALYHYGRIARNNLVERQSDIAQQELGLVATQNNLERAIADVAKLLNLPTAQPLVAIETPAPPAELALPEFDQLLNLTLANSSEYLSAVNAMQNAEFDLLEAKDKQQWDLQFKVDYSIAGSSESESTNDIITNLALSREFGSMNIENLVQNSEINRQIVTADLAQIRQNIERDLRTRIRDLTDSFQSIKLAQDARILAASKVDNAKKQINLSSSTITMTDIINFEQDLVQAQNQELTAIIDHLNQRTQLEQILGITLDTWQVNPQLIFTKP